MTSLVSYAGSSSSEEDEGEQNVCSDSDRERGNKGVDQNHSTRVKVETKKTVNSISQEVWQQCLDKSSGQVYFWNKITGETTWNRPNAKKKLENTIEMKGEEDKTTKSSDQEVSQDTIISVSEDKNTSSNIETKDSPSASKRRRVDILDENDNKDGESNEICGQKDASDIENTSSKQNKQESFTSSVLIKGAGVLSKKLQFLKHDITEISSHVALHSSMMIRLEDFKAGELSTKYFADKMKKAEAEIKLLEKQTAPEGWKLVWESEKSAYFFASLETGDTSWTMPSKNLKAETATQEKTKLLSARPMVHPDRVKKINNSGSRSEGEKNKSSSAKKSSFTNKKVASLMEKWNKVNETESTINTLEHISSEEWKTRKHGSTNANLENIVGDWKKKRERLMEKKKMKLLSEKLI